MARRERPSYEFNNSSKVLTVVDVEIVEESVAALPDYGRIPISFEVESIFDVQVLDSGLAGFRLSERPVPAPWIKDYDSYDTEGPERWAKRWNILNWAVISSFVEGSRTGGCVIAYDTPGVHMLEDRKDIAAIWDLRVLPRFRREGIGGRLIEAAIAWARQHHCRKLKVETQNINVPACRLYVKHGFTLGSLNRYAYPELPDEVQFIWYMEL